MDIATYLSQDAIREAVEAERSRIIAELTDAAASADFGAVDLADAIAIVRGEQ